MGSLAAEVQRWANNVSESTMKQCPTCNRTYSDVNQSFCLDDGTPLTVPYDPDATKVITPANEDSTPAGSVKTMVAPPVPFPVVTPTSGPAPQTRGSSGGKILLVGCLSVIGIVVALGLAGGAYLWWRTSYTPPPRKAPDIPQRAAGAMTEFPVDNDPNGPRPTSVVTQSLTPGTTSSQSGSSSTTTLPPGVDRSSLSRGATTMTSATYRAHPQKAATQPTTTIQTKGGADEIYICVLTAMPSVPDFGGSLANTTMRATGGERTGVSVQSPKGAAYKGSRIRSPQGTTYVLTKQGGEVVILIYAPDPATKDVVDTLAQRVGNGEGLNDYPDIKGSLWTLPVSTPSDLTLEEINTLTRAQIENSIASSGAGQGGDDVQRLLAQMRQFIPERMTGARYSDTRRQEWVAVGLEYPSTFEAWKTWLLARGALGLGGAKSATVSGVDGLSLEQDGKLTLVFQKGPYLVLLSGPGAAALDRLVALGNQFQV
jgi:hypothetical protein